MGTAAAKAMMGVVETGMAMAAEAAAETGMAMLAETVALATSGAAMLATRPEVPQATAATEGIPMEAASEAAWVVDLVGM